MKNFIYCIALCAGAIAGVLSIHFQAGSDALLELAADRRGDPVDQVASGIEDRVAQVTKGWVDIGAERRAWVEEVQVKALSSGDIADRCAVVAGAALTVAVIFAFGGGRSGYRMVTGAALGLWVLGVVLPVLTVRVSADVEHIGQIIVKEETKSLVVVLMDAIGKGNWVSIVAIGVCGVAFPLLKTVLGLTEPGSGLIHRVAQALGRLSIVDLVVIGLLVVYLGSGDDPNMATSLGSGAYFFGAYGLLMLVCWWLPSREERSARPAFATSQGAGSQGFDAGQPGGW